MMSRVSRSFRPATLVQTNHDDSVDVDPRGHDDLGIEATDFHELVRLDMQRPRNRQQLLPLVAGVIRGSAS